MAKAVPLESGIVGQVLVDLPRAAEYLADMLPRVFMRVQKR